MFCGRSRSRGTTSGSSPRSRGRSARESSASTRCRSRITAGRTARARRSPGPTGSRRSRSSWLSASVAEPVTEVALRPPAPRPSSRYVLAAAGLGVSGAVAWLAVRKVDPTDFVAAFRQSDWWCVLPAAAALTAAVALRLLRWRLLFAAGRRPPIRPLGRAFLIGYLFNSILPARPGELARAVALRREVGTPVAEALATTAAERLYDVAALLALLFVGALFVPALVIVVAANLTLLVPASPGGLGVFEAATVAVLASFAVDRSAALSYAVALHGLNLFPYVVAGAFALFRHTQFVRARDRP